MPYDGLVCLFSVRNDAADRDIDYDEVRSDVFWCPLIPSLCNHIVQDQISDTFRQMILDVNFLFSHETLISCKTCQICVCQVAWELEKVLIYHSISAHPHRLLNQEGVMARRGLEPISRKVITNRENTFLRLVFGICT